MISVASARYHRNGSFGAGYFTVTFRANDTPLLFAVVFEADEHIAILDAEGRSWRYEDFADDLRAFLASPGGDFLAFSRPANAQTMETA